MSQLNDRQVGYLRSIGIDYWVPRQVQTDQVVSTATASANDADEAVSTRAGFEVDWQTLQQQVSACQRCDLHKTRTHTVFGTGSVTAQWMFVGEAPGSEEDRQGLPFVGRAGQLLSAMLQSIGLSRNGVYIANVLKCRPPNNRDPMGQEVRACEPYLHRQVAAIRPKLIVALGRFAAQSLLKTTRPINKLRGETFTYEGIPLIVTYHPAYLLRNAIDKRKVWHDLCRAKQLMEQAQ
jgi:uracil-DNA glycosylase family 4